MSSIITRGEALKTQIAAALGDLVDLVTLDGVGLKPSTRAAVMIYPPEISFPTFGERDTVWKIAVTAGPANQPMRALARIDQMIAALEAANLNMARAEPVTFDLAGGGSLPAYEITLNNE
ncbi:MAG: hypothetical protein ACTJGT_01730 [Microbacteriaceae bacterium]